MLMQGLGGARAVSLCRLDWYGQGGGLTGRGSMPFLGSPHGPGALATSCEVMGSL
jgi:hypothetical protein